METMERVRKLHRRFHESGRKKKYLDKAIALMTRLVEDDPASPRWKGILADLLVLRTEDRFTEADRDRAIALYEDACAGTEPGGRRTAWLFTLAALLSHRCRATGRLGDARRAEEVLGTAVGGYDGLRNVRWLDHAAETGVTVSTVLDRDEPLAVAIAFIEAVDPAGLDDDARTRRHEALGTLLLERYERSGVYDDLDAAHRHLVTATARTPVEHPESAVRLARQAVSGVHLYRRDGHLGDLEDAIGCSRQALALVRDDGRRDDIGLNLAVQLVAAGTVPAVDEAVAMYASRAARGEPAARLLEAYGQALRLRHELTGRAADLETAADLLAEAVARTPPGDGERLERLSAHAALLADRGDPADLPLVIEELEEVVRLLGGRVHHPRWTKAHLFLAQALRAAGRHEEGHRLATAGLLGHASATARQANMVDALRAARDAGDDALLVAWWCLQDGRPADAVEVIERCRCLVLQASGSDPEPPTSADVRRTLRDLAIDALVYLVPGNDELAGAALVVPPRGEPYAVTLPLLVTHAHPAAQRYLETTGELYAGSDAPGWEDTLPDVCDWAWKAAMGPLIAALPEGTPRVVLVPCAHLSVIPWHAARVRDEEADGHRYAAERLLISYAPSARTLLDLGRRRPAPPDGPALLVADPTGDLRHAGKEVAALRDAHHPGTPILGRGSATPQRVVAAIGESSLLHLACHGRLGGGLHTTYLMLADRARLSVGDLLRLRDRRTPPDQGPLVVLSACATNVSADGTLDESLTLATGFLSAGASAVISTLWLIADDGAARFMATFYYYLRDQGKTPADALRAAQLAYSADPRELTTWAAFTHHGR